MLKKEMLSLKGKTSPLLSRDKLPEVSKKPPPVIETAISPATVTVEKSAPPPQPAPKPQPKTEAKSKPEPAKPKERLREPEFVLKLRDRSAAEGSSVRLACRAMGTPEPTFQWFKDDKPISAGGRFDISQSVSGFTLVIKDCQVEDSGEYKCETSNKAGSVSTSANVTVTGWYFLERCVRFKSTQLALIQFSMVNHLFPHTQAFYEGYVFLQFLHFYSIISKNNFRVW